MLHATCAQLAKQEKGCVYTCAAMTRPRCGRTSLPVTAVFRWRSRAAIGRILTASPPHMCKHTLMLHSTVNHRCLRIGVNIPLLNASFLSKAFLKARPIYSIQVRKVTRWEQRKCHGHSSVVFKISGSQLTNTIL